ncbi:ATP-binding Cassette (ABC) Superfamily, partial [Achlya hypogyna]
MNYNTFDATSAAAAAPHPLATAGIASRLVYGWVLPLLSLGHSRQLDPSDLWPLEEPNSCAGVVPSFLLAYTEHKTLLRTFVALYGWRFALVGAIQLLLVPCTLYGPYVLHLVLEQLSTPNAAWDALLTPLATLFGVQVLAAFLAAHTDYIDKVLVVRLTAGIQHLLYAKTLALDAAGRRVKSSGELSNHFTSDVNAILRVTFYINYLWIMPVQIGVTLFMLYRIISWATFFGLAILLLGAPITNALVKARYRAMDRFMEQKDQRMRLVNEVFGAIQIIKLNAWEEAYEAKLCRLRVAELTSLRRLFVLASATISMAYVIPATVTVASLATYTLLQRESVSVATVFGALALFTSLSTPLNNFPHTLTSALTGLVSVRRLDAFLALPERTTDIVDTPASLPPADREALAAANVAIAVEDGRFGWDATKPFFTDLNLRVRTGELVVVHGAVGEGKSSLCAVLLGELEKQRGSVFVGGRVSYFSQQPWIQNLTIRENILFGKPYDRTKYAAVLEACALTKDLAAFPAGDRTEIGQKGVNVSGGQKARIALARACYNDGDIFLLDSPLSAVDAIVSNEIFTKCFLGLLSRKTVFLVTHNPEIIASKHVDRTIEIKDGRCLDTVNAAKEPFASPIAPLPTTNDKDPEPLDAPLPSASEPQSPSAKHLLVHEEARSEGRVSSHVFTKYFRSAGGPWVVAGVVLVQASWQGLVVSRDVWLSEWASSPDLASTAAYGIGVYAGLCALCALFVIARVQSVALAGHRASAVLVADMTSALLRAPLAFFDSTPIGRILNRFGADATKLDLDVTFTFTFMLGTLSGLLLTVITAAFATGRYSLLMVPAVYAYYRVGLFYVQPARDVERLSKVAASPLLNLIGESIDGAAVIRAFGPSQERRFQRLHHATVDRSNAAVLVRQVLQQWLLLQTQLLSAVLILVITTALVSLRSALTPGWIGVVFNYALSIPSSLQYLIQDASDLEIAMIAPERLL